MRSVTQIVPAYPPVRSRPGRTVLLSVSVVASTVVVLTLIVTGTVLLINHAGPNGQRRVARQDGTAVDGARRCGPGDTGSAIALPAELMTTVGKGRPVITPVQAQAVVTAVWGLRERALYSCDRATLALLETGSARIGDLGRAECGCLIRPENAPILDRRTSVPRQTSYPAYFVTEVRTEDVTGNSWGEIMVFTRSAPTSHWQLNLATGSVADPGRVIGLRDPLVDAAGYVNLPDRRTRRAAETAAGRLAALWQESKDTGRVPANSFAPTAWTTSLPLEIAEFPQDTTQRNGLKGHFTYRVLPTDPMFHVLGSAGDMACTVLRVTSTYTAARGGDDPGQTRDRKNWGYNLAPGTYASVTANDVSQTCFFVPTSGLGQIHVIGGDYLAEGLTSGVPRSR
jgi:hypothetical protein